jgi:hypothetical protein
MSKRSSPPPRDIRLAPGNGETIAVFAASIAVAVAPWLMLVPAAALLVTAGIRSRRGESWRGRSLMLAYRAPTANRATYRERGDVTVADLLFALERLGYRPEAVAADADGKPAGRVDVAAPLVGAHLLWRQPGWRGWIRIELPTPGGEPPIPGTRLLGTLEVRSHNTAASDQACLFTLRALDELLGEVEAGPTDSHGFDPAELLTCALPPRPALAPGAAG